MNANNERTKERLEDLRYRLFMEVESAKLDLQQPGKTDLIYNYYENIIRDNTNDIAVLDLLIEQLGD